MEKTNDGHDDREQRAALLRQQERQARIEGVIAEFGGPDVALERMAEELLHCRWALRTIIEVIDRIRSEEPFIVVPARWAPNLRQARSEGTTLSTAG